MASQLVSELLSRTERAPLESLLDAARFANAKYQARLAHIVNQIARGSPLFGLLRQVLNAITPHMGTLGGFNAAFTTAAATMHKCFDAMLTAVSEDDKWHVLTTCLLNIIPRPSISPEEELQRLSKTKSETLSEFVDRYCACAQMNPSSMELKTKTLYRKLPANMRRTVMHLHPTADLSDFSNIIRNSTYWESGRNPVAENDKDVDIMDIDMTTVQANTVGTGEGKVVQNGRLNFQAISTAGRVMIGAREICKNSRKEAANMLRFLQRLLNNTGTQNNFKRATGRRFDNRRTYMAGTSGGENVSFDEGEIIPEGIDTSFEIPCEEVEETIDEEVRVNMAKTTTQQQKRRVLKLGLTSLSHLGYPRRIEALVDTGAESSIMSLALAKELGAKIRPDQTRLMMAHGKITHAQGKCTVNVALNKDPRTQFQMDCLLLHNPGYELLLGIDAMEDNGISPNPSKRSVTMNGKVVKCCIAGGVAHRDVQNKLVNEAVGQYTERVTHLPVRKGDKISIPLNRSLVLGPRETKMVKCPFVLRKEMMFKRSPTITHGFSVQIGAQMKDHTVLALHNHKEEPFRLTPRTVIFSVPAEAALTTSVITEDGQSHLIRDVSRFARRQ